MKLARYGESGFEKPCVLDPDGGLRCLADVVPDVSGPHLGDKAWDRLRGLNLSDLPVVPGDARLGPCVGGVGKCLAIGLNYADHAAEAGMDLPREPIVFMKATSALCGPNDEVIVPLGAKKLDWEVELGVVIGQEARNVSESRALECVAGYCLFNDISERSFQLEGTGQWVKGKSADTFGPMGPWLVSRDEVSDPQDLELWLDVDGVRRQTGSTKAMVFGVAEVVSYLSRFMSLQPGDLIVTGTPPGVGMGFNPPIFLAAGSTMSLGITGLGEQHQRVVPHAEEAMVESV